MTSCNDSRERVVLVGSTSVQPFVGAIAEEYVKTFPEYSINVQGGGSSTGITAVSDGTADIGMSSRGLRSAELERLEYTTIAKDALALIVHPDNPVSGLTTEQARKIYSGEITDWGEIGGTQGRKIHVISREAGSGTRSVFEDVIMRDGEDRIRISNKAMVQSTNGTIRQLVAGDVDSIGYISLGLIEQQGSKPVKGLDLDGISPTVANVQNESYTFFRPFLFVLNPAIELSESSQKFIDYILSREGQELLAGEGLVPVMDLEGAGE